MRTRRMAQAVTLLGSWLLVQVPEKELSLTDPGHPMAPIAHYTKIKEFETYDQCEFYRGNAIQDAMSEGSPAMSAQAATLRCMSSDPATQPPADPTPLRTP